MIASTQCLVTGDIWDWEGHRSWRPVLLAQAPRLGLLSRFRLSHLASGRCPNRKQEHNPIPMFAAVGMLRSLWGHFLKLQAELSGVLGAERGPEARL